MLKQLKRLNINERGDTIIEVLFAVVVIGIVLAGSYNVVARSILAEEDAQQHTYALGLVQSQIELLRSYVLSPGYSATPTLFVNPGCMDTTTDTPVAISGSTPICIVPLNSANPSGNSYSLSIQLDPTDPTSNIYLVTASWPSSISGVASGQDEISIPYRIQL